MQSAGLPLLMLVPAERKYNTMSEEAMESDAWVHLVPVPLLR